MPSKKKVLEDYDLENYIFKYFNKKVASAIREVSTIKLGWELGHPYSSAENPLKLYFPLKLYLLKKAMPENDSFKLNEKYEGHISQCKSCQELYNAYIQCGKLLRGTQPRI